jgi:hypothetical protein
MALRYQRRIRIAPGLSLNLNKRSISTSIGRRGAHFTVGSGGQRGTIGIPGTGLVYTTYRRTQSRIVLIVLIGALVVLGVIFRLA